MEDTIKLLIVDDSHDDAELLISELALRGWVVYWKRVADEVGLRHALAEERWDIAFSDMRMPQLTMERAVVLIQELQPDIPVVVMSGIVEGDEAIRLFKMGVRDFIIKDNLSHLSMIVRREMLASESRRAWQKAEAALRNQQKQIHAQEKLLKAQSDHKLTSVINSALDAIITLDIYGRVISYNPAAEALFGYDADTVIGKDIALLIIPPHLRNSHRRALAKYLEYPEAKVRLRRRLELQGLRINGTTVDLDVSLNSISFGGELQFMAFMRDITERRQLLQSLRETLEIAEAASQSKSAFIANMSHEIRTPMNAVIGFTELALREALSPKLCGYLGRLKDSSHALLSIINDILDFSKLEAGKVMLDPVAFVLSDMFDYLSSIFSQQISEKNIELLFSLPPGPPQTFFGDEQRLKQVLINLIRNAVKFTDTGTIVVAAQHGALRDDAMVGLTFVVRDSGIGISPDQLPRLFDPFVQADGSTTRKYGGTGLGLTICKHLVGVMGGQIWAESVPGEGSLFHFTVVCERRMEAERAPLVFPERFRNMKLLIIDDNAWTHENLKTMFAAWLWRPTVVDSVHDALRELARGEAAKDPYALVLMDWQMPDMDSSTAVQNIILQCASHTPEGRRPKIIMMIAFGQEEMRQKAEESGVDIFLDKPFTLYPVFVAVMTAFKEEVTDPFPRSKMVVGEQKTQEVLEGARVLLVEDHPINQEVAIALLERVGLRVEVADNGSDAVEKVRTTSYHAVLMDIQMPGIDGYETTRRIRRHGRFKDLPIIAMTAHAMADEKKQCLDAGMNDHIPKPIRSETLYGVLTQWIGPIYIPSSTLKKQIKHRGGKVHIPQVPGIDRTDGLKRVAGDTRLYRRLLVRFRKEQRDTAQQVTTAIAAGDMKTAERLAHAVKGVAGNIGAKYLSCAAGVLEKTLRKGKLLKKTSVKNVFVDELTRVLNALEAVEEGAEHAHGHPDITPMPLQGPAEPMDRLLTELQQHLKMSSLETVTLIQKINKGLKNNNEVKELKRLEKCVGDYEFDAALRSLDTLAALLGISLPEAS